jgi:methylenetetrahydrofolate reductase (NADPH)
MKVVEHLANATRPLVSVEIIPPRRGGDVRRIYDAVRSIMPFDPPFIDITSHAGEAVWDELPDGTWRRRVTRKAPGTFGLCAAIKHRFDVGSRAARAVQRVHTRGDRGRADRAELPGHRERARDPRRRRPAPSVRRTNRERDRPRSRPPGRGDEPRRVSRELVESTPTDFFIGVAAYPEKHVEAPNLERDIAMLLEKQRSGAHYAVTQILLRQRALLPVRQGLS